MNSRKIISILILLAVLSTGMMNLASASTLVSEEVVQSEYSVPFVELGDRIIKQTYSDGIFEYRYVRGIKNQALSLTNTPDIVEVTEGEDIKIRFTFRPTTNKLTLYPVPEKLEGFDAATGKFLFTSSIYYLTVDGSKTVLLNIAQKFSPPPGTYNIKLVERIKSGWADDPTGWYRADEAIIKVIVHPKTTTTGSCATGYYYNTNTDQCWPESGSSTPTTTATATPPSDNNEEMEALQAQLQTLQDELAAQGTGDDTTALQDQIDKLQTALDAAEEAKEGDGETSDLTYGVYGFIAIILGGTLFKSFFG